MADDGRRQLLVGVEARRREIGQAILARVHAVGAGEPETDAEYLEGLRSAVETAIDHTIGAASRVDGRPSEVPTSIVTQARLAARRKTPVDKVLRRYFAGHAVLGDFIVEEAERQAVAPQTLRQVMRSQAAETDRVLAVISDVYRQEVKAASLRSTGIQQTERVRRLLSGELVDPGGFVYDFDRWHIGFVVHGPGRDELVKEIVSHFGGPRLIVPGGDDLTWAWIGIGTRPAPDWSVKVRPSRMPNEASMGIGEPGRGRVGWRLTHEQALAAFTVALRGGDKAARYSHVALVASAIRDELLTNSLKTLYLEPLQDTREGGQILRDTLRAYLRADRNVTSTASALGVSRNTVHNRLRTIEARIGRLRPPQAGDLGLALQLDELLASR